MTKQDKYIDSLKEQLRNNKHGYYNISDEWMLDRTYEQIETWVKNKQGTIKEIGEWVKNF
jgi:hypothetical protein